MGSENIWVEIGHSNQEPNIWQALFACQVCIQPFEKVEKRKWGMNPAFLFDEVVERQKLFVESQYNHNAFQEDAANERTVTFRCLQIPGSGLLLALVGKVGGRTQESARLGAIAYCEELMSIFPYEYILHPALSAETFHYLTGRDILNQCSDLSSLVEIKRFETQVRTQKNLAYVIGLWQTGKRSDEQIWRSLGNFPNSAMLTISLRSTHITDKERQLLWNMTQVQAVDNYPIPNGVPPFIPPYHEWSEPFIKQRLSPWKRFFYLQIHIMVPSGVSDSLLRGIGSAITRDTPEQSSPGFLANWPGNQTDIYNWKKSLDCLEIIPNARNNTGLSRLSNIADMSEVHSVFRFPFPPMIGLPNINFLQKLE